MNDKISEYKQLLPKLWNELEDDRISEEEYHSKKRRWFEENADSIIFCIRLP